MDDFWQEYEGDLKIGDLVDVFVFDNTCILWALGALEKDDVCSVHTNF